MMHSCSTAASLLAATHVSLGTLAQACCPVGPPDSHVINTDQSVIMIWDQQRQTQHFIRRADFKTDAKDIGFLVPSPSRPQLEEAGDAAFSQLADITAPTPPRSIPIPFACSAPQAALGKGVVVIEQKRVAGYDATVLTARSGDDLVEWLQQNGYPYSPAIATWASPYLSGDWHFTALKLIKSSPSETTLAASALRISFHTEKPLFPYREPDSEVASQALENKFRLLRIYFIAETQYQGHIRDRPWSGRTRWSGDITTHRAKLLTALRLDENVGPETFWLTEFEDQWPYEKAAGDIYFSPVAKLMLINRDGKNEPVQLDASLLVLLALSALRKLRHQAR